jgi:hypothetical protein
MTDVHVHQPNTRRAALADAMRLARASRKRQRAEAKKKEEKGDAAGRKTQVRGGL